MIITLAFLFVLIAAMSLFVLNRRFHNRIVRFSRSVAVLAEDKDAKARLDAGGPGAFGAMADSINLLLDSREKQIDDLKFSEERYRGIVENLAEMICRFLPDGTLTFSNEAFEQFMADFIDTPGKGAPGHLKLDNPELAVVVDRLTSLSKTNPVTDFELEVKPAGGDAKSIHGTCRAIFNEAGSVAEYQIVARDATLLKAAEQASERSRRFASLAQLMRGLSHEINNHLAVVQAYVEILREHDGIVEIADEKTESSFEAIKTAIERISKVLGGLTSLVRDSEFNPVAVDASSQLSILVEMLRPALEKDNIEFELKSDKFEIYIDESRFNRLISNLITNAVNSISGGGRIAIEARPMPDGKQAEIAVSDDGTGISEADLKRVFEPFYSKNPADIGMGLYMCRRYMEDHGGSIALSSAEGKGTRAVLRFPARPNQREGMR